MIWLLFGIVWLGWAAVSILTAGTLRTSIREREWRAAGFSGLLIIGLLGMAVLGFKGHLRGGSFTWVFLLIGGPAFVLLPIFMLIPFGKYEKVLHGTEGYIVGEVTRFDERDQVFARNRSIRPQSKEYEDFYGRHPEWKDADDKRREMGGPISNPAKYDGSAPHLIAMFHSSFVTVGVLGINEVVNPQPIPPQRERLEKMMGGMDAAKLTQLVKSYAKYLGADDVGVARLDQSWVYSHRGEIHQENWEDWGKPIVLDRPFAVMFTVEMGWEMTATDPHTGALVEGGLQYSRGAWIADVLARFIASMGFEASADHFRHYNMVQVPVAVDAGLGEMGRFGYLISRKRGSRVRTSGVTTNMPLVPDKPVDMGVQHFCSICKKCAITCPSKAIPETDEKTEVNGSMRWKLDEIKCYDWWGRMGSGCGVCMRVCPFGHESTWPHDVMRFMAGRNPLSRHLLHLGDNIFYGTHPKHREMPSWMELGLGHSEKQIT